MTSGEGAWNVRVLRGLLHHVAGPACADDLPPRPNLRVPGSVRPGGPAWLLSAATQGGRAWFSRRLPLLRVPTQQYGAYWFKVVSQCRGAALTCILGPRGAMACRFAMSGAPCRVRRRSPLFRSRIRINLASIAFATTFAARALVLLRRTARQETVSPDAGLRRSRRARTASFPKVPPLWSILMPKRPRGGRR